MSAAQGRRKTIGRGRPGASDVVWIVQHDESPHNTILGVFGTGAEAMAFMDEVSAHFKKGVICAGYPIGYRHTDSSERYRPGD